MLSLEEFSKRYTNTWCKFKKDYVVIIRGFEGPLLYLDSQQLGTMQLYYPKILEDLDLTPPVSGYFNHNNNALYLLKLPRRQWKRGLCQDNHEIYNPISRLVNSGVYRALLGRTSISALYNRVFMRDLTEIEAMLTNKTPIVSVAASLNLMISKSPVLKPKLVLWLGLIPCGFIDTGEIQICDENFRQEVLDELRNSELNWKISN